MKMNHLHYLNHFNVQLHFNFNDLLHNNKLFNQIFIFSLTFILSNNHNKTHILLQKNIQLNIFIKTFLINTS